MLCGGWGELPVLARWTHPFFPAVTAGVDVDWLAHQVKTVNVRADQSSEIRSAVMSATETERVVSLLRDLGLNALLHLQDDNLASTMTSELNQALSLLWGQLNALDPKRTVALQRLRGLKYPAEVLVPQVLASYDLRCKKMLRHHANKFVEMLPEALRPVLREWTSNQLASGTTLQRSEMVLDVALQLLHRSRMLKEGRVLKFAWGDATSKFDLELYNGRYRWLPESLCVNLARAWRFLCNHCHEAEEMADIQQKRCEFSDLLFRNVHLHTLVPQNLGDRRTSLPDKVSAYIHASLLESTGLEDLENSCASHVSWCSDMGVEAGIPNFFLKQVEDALPEWLRPVRLHVVPDEQVEDGAELLSNDVGDSVKTLMPRALQMSGVCHAVHNSSLNLQSAFKGFDDFLLKLKCLYKFLGNSLRVSRFLEVVMRDTPHYEHAKKLFTKKLTSVHTERWNVLAICLEESLPLVQFLRVHWDAVRFSIDPQKCSVEAMANPSKHDGWAPEQVTEIIADSYFFAFWYLQHALYRRVLQFQSWAEGCSCHGGSEQFDFG